MQPHTPLARVQREELPSHMQRSWDDAQQLHGDTSRRVGMDTCPFIPADVG
jgi:hypothetical protein